MKILLHRFKTFHLNEQGATLVESVAWTAAIAVMLWAIYAVLLAGAPQMVGAWTNAGINQRDLWEGRGNMPSGWVNPPPIPDATYSSGAAAKNAANSASKPGFWGQVGGFFVGIGSGAWDMAKGLGSLAWDGVRGLPGIGDVYGLFDPQGTAAVRAKYGQLWDAITNDPLGTGKQMLAGILGPIVNDWKDGQYGKAIGRGTFEVGMLLLPETKLGSAGEAANTADKAVEGANAAEKAAEAASTVGTVGEAANIADKAQEAANQLAKIGLNAPEAPQLVDTIAAAATQGSTTNGITVLGHYDEYIQKAKELDGAYLNFPGKTWDALASNPDAQWAVNQRFLDMAIERGDTFVLATPLNEVRSGSYLEKELQYLGSKGYQVVERNGMQVIVPK